MHERKSSVCAALIVVAAAITSPALQAAPTPTEHIMIPAADLKWSEGPKSLPPGTQIAAIEGDPSKEGPFTVRLKMPANYKIMPHWHPAIEHVTVLEGDFFMGMGEQFTESKGKKLPPGGFAVMPKEFRHFAFTKGKPVTIQLHGIGPWDILYVDPANDPRKTKNGS